MKLFWSFARSAVAVVSFSLFLVSSPAAPGDIDTTFTSLALAPSGSRNFTVAADGKIVLAGDFTKVGNVDQAGLARLNADGTHDPTLAMPPGENGLWFFQPAQAIPGTTIVIPEVKRQGSAVDAAVQADGAMIVAGDFTRVRGVARTRVAKLKADGSLDAGSSAGSGPNDEVFDLLLLPGDQVLVGGKFGMWNDASLGDASNRQGILRLNKDGSRDATFAFPTDLGGPSSYAALALGPGGKYYAVAATAILGSFTPKIRVVRLNADGTRDGTFQMVEVANTASYLAVDAAGGGVVTGGSLKRFTSGGVEDAAYATRLGAGAFGAVVFLPDGRLMVNDALKGIRRAQTDGTPDAAYASKGILAPARIHLLPDGKLLASAAVVLSTFTPGIVRLQGDVAAAPVLTAQPASQRVTEGATAVFEVNATGAGPFTYQWQRDGVDLGGATERVLRVSNVTAGGTYRVRVSNASGTTPSDGAVLTVLPATPGAVYMDTARSENADARISVVARAPEGKLVVAGTFAKVAGANRHRLARFLSDGTIDPAFDTSAAPFPTIVYIHAAAVQSNGAVVIVGNISAQYGGREHRILRYTSAGKLDETFATAAGGVLGANDIISLLVLPDDRLLVGGLFAALLDGTTAPGMVMLNADGTRNTAFNAGGAGFNRSAGVQSFANHTGGAVLVAANSGAGLTYNGTPVKALSRLFSDGKLDADFTAKVPGDVAPNFLAVQPDGKILIAGGLDRLNPGLGANTFVKRLNADGSLDTSFDTTVIGPQDTKVTTAWSFAIQPDERILVGGTVSVGGGVARPAVYRLEPNGRFDSTFQIAFAGAADFTPVLGVGILKEGAMLAGGEFKGFGGEARTNLARLNTGPFGFTPATPPTIEEQTVDQTLLEGDTATFSITAGGTPPFRYQWYYDGAAMPGETGPTLTVPNLTVDKSGRYYCAVVNAGGTNLSNPNRGVLTVNARNPWPGTNDLSCSLSRSFGLARVDAFLVLQSGRLLVGGQFSTLTEPQTTWSVVRLNPDWSRDTDFADIRVTVTGQEPTVTGLAELPGGRLMIGGTFDKVNGVARGGLARLNEDGSLDAGYDAGTLSVAKLTSLPDGKLLVLSGVGPTGTTMRRLNADGSPDASFALPPDIDARQVELLPDGRMLISGQRIVRNAQGQTLRAEFYAARYTANGGVDPTYRPNALVETLFALPGVKLLAGGHNLFNDQTGSGQKQVARLSETGAVDVGFAAQTIRLGNVFQGVNHAVVQADESVLIASYFDAVGDLANPHRTYHLARLRPDGVPDTGFKTYLTAPTSLPAIAQLGLQLDGKILVLQGGQLSRLHAGPSVVGPAGVIADTPSISGNSLSVSVKTEAGRSYALEYKATLSAANWTTVATVSGDGTTKSLTHTPLANPSGFYRVRVD